MIFRSVASFGGEICRWRSCRRGCSTRRQCAFHWVLASTPAWSDRCYELGPDRTRCNRLCQHASRTGFFYRTGQILYYVVTYNVWSAVNSGRVAVVHIQWKAAATHSYLSALCLSLSLSLSKPLHPPTSPVHGRPNNHYSPWRSSRRASPGGAACSNVCDVSNTHKSEHASVHLLKLTVLSRRVVVCVGGNMADP